MSTEREVAIAKERAAKDLEGLDRGWGLARRANETHEAVQYGLKQELADTWTDEGIMCAVNDALEDTLRKEMTNKQSPPMAGIFLYLIDFDLVYRLCGERQ